MSDLLKTVQESCQNAIAAVKDISARAPGTLTTQALVVGALAGFLAYRLMKKRYRLPPGPRPWPLIGNLLSIFGKEPFYMKLARWAKENYGPVIGVYFGPIFCVTLNDLKSINEALVLKGNDFAGRPVVHSLDTLSEGSKDIAFADYSPAWKLHRKIALQAMRHYMTGSHIEKIVHRVIAMVADRMAAEPGPFDPCFYNFTLMYHIIDGICFGEAKPFDDPYIQQQLEIADVVVKDMGKGFLEDYVPLLRYCPTKKFRRFLAVLQTNIDYLETNIQKHRQNFSPSNVHDITDSILLAQMEATREESPEAMAMFTDVHVRQTISNLFGAGVDTSRRILDWAFLFIAGHPEIQKRAQAEIDAATGPRMPGVRDRHKLQYTEAVLYETLRLGSVPIAAPHKTLCDSTVGGYDVPKGTMVLVNIWAVSNDPQQWDEPDQFKPQRFLNDEGKLKTTKPEGWLPFSAGRRMCLGENVARLELLLLLACFLKRFTISLPEGVQYSPDCQRAGMILYAPKPYKIVVTSR